MKDAAQKLCRLLFREVNICAGICLASKVPMSLDQHRSFAKSDLRFQMQNCTEADLPVTFAL